MSYVDNESSPILFLFVIIYFKEIPRVTKGKIGNVEGQEWNKLP